MLKNGISIEQISLDTGVLEDIITSIFEEIVSEEIFSPFETINS